MPITLSWTIQKKRLYRELPGHRGLLYQECWGLPGQMMAGSGSQGSGGALGQPQPWPSDTSLGMGMRPGWNVVPWVGPGWHGHGQARSVIWQEL